MQIITLCSIQSIINRQIRGDPQVPGMLPVQELQRLHGANRLCSSQQHLSAWRSEPEHSFLVLRHSGCREKMYLKKISLYHMFTFCTSSSINHTMIAFGFQSALLSHSHVLVECCKHYQGWLIPSVTGL